MDLVNEKGELIKKYRDKDGKFNPVWMYDNGKIKINEPSPFFKTFSDGSALSKAFVTLGTSLITSLIKYGVYSIIDNAIRCSEEVILSELFIYLYFSSLDQSKKDRFELIRDIQSDYLMYIYVKYREKFSKDYDNNMLYSIRDSFLWLKDRNVFRASMGKYKYLDEKVIPIVVFYQYALEVNIAEFMIDNIGNYKVKSTLSNQNIDATMITGDRDDIVELEVVEKSINTYTNMDKLQMTDLIRRKYKDCKEWCELL